MILHGGFPTKVRPPFAVRQELDFVKQWATLTASALVKVIENPSSGLFNPACFMHTEFSSDAPEIGGVDFITAVGDWIHSREGTSRIHIDQSPMFGGDCPQIVVDDDK
jgi:hypothetical protein